MSEKQSLEQFINQQLKNGTYKSYDEMVDVGLQLLKEREQELDRIAEKLRPAVKRMKMGQPGIEVDIEDIIEQGIKRLTETASCK